MRAASEIVVRLAKTAADECAAAGGELVFPRTDESNSAPGGGRTGCQYGPVAARMAPSKPQVTGAESRAGSRASPCSSPGLGEVDETDKNPQFTGTVEGDPRKAPPDTEGIETSPTRRNRSLSVVAKTRPTPRV